VYEKSGRALSNVKKSYKTIRPKKTGPLKDPKIPVDTSRQRLYNQDVNAPTLMTEVQPINGNGNGHPVLSYRAQLLQKAQPRVPSTAEGLPVGYYRVDLLPMSHQGAEADEVQALKNAYSDLSFEYGYPTLPDGRPFWHKLDFEPGFAYGAFQMYLEEIREGPRELTKLSTNEELLQLASQVQPLANEEQWSPKRLNDLLYEFSVLYIWRPRSRAHDVYKEAAYRHLRLKRQMSVEDEHYTLAANLLQQLKEKVLNTPKFFDNMKPQTAADLLQKLVGIQRVSVGLPAAGPLSQKETPEDTSFEMIIRSLAQRTGNIYENGAVGSALGSESRGILSSVLKDPEAAKNLQEVIIRVTRAQQQRLPNPHEQQQGHQFKSRQRAAEIITQEDLQGPYDLTGAPGENVGADVMPEEKRASRAG